MVYYIVPDPYLANPEEQTSKLMLAIRNKNFEAVKELLKSYDASRYEAKDAEFKVLEMILTSIENNCPSITKLFLDKYPSFCFLIGNNYQYKLMTTAITRGDVDTVKFILERGPENNYEKFIMTRPNATPRLNALHVSAKAGHLEIVKLLLTKGAFINGKNRNHKTPLHVARGHSSVVDYLIANGALVNVPDAQGLIPLHCAAAGPCVECVKILLKHGADWTILNRSDQTILHYAAKASPVVLEYIIKLKLFDVDVQDQQGNAPFHSAVQYSIANTEVLLRFGANINCRNYKGETPLYLAITQGRGNIVNCLLSQGADFTSKDHNGISIAKNIFNVNFGCLFPLLMKHGFDVNSLLEEEASTLESWLGQHNSVLLKEIAFAVAQNQYVDGKFFELITMTENLTLMYECCEQELKNMMTEKIEGTAVSFFDICARNSDQLIDCFRIDKVYKTVFTCNALKAKFPNYGQKIFEQFKTGKEAKLTMEKCKSICYFAFSHLPATCFERIVSFLSNFDMRNLIQACKREY